MRLTATQVKLGKNFEKFCSKLLELKYERFFVEDSLVFQHKTVTPEDKGSVYDATALYPVEGGERKIIFEFKFSVRNQRRVDQISRYLKQVKEGRAACVIEMYHLKPEDKSVYNTDYGVEGLKEGFYELSPDNFPSLIEIIVSEGIMLAHIHVRYTVLTKYF